MIAVARPLKPRYRVCYGWCAEQIDDDYYTRTGAEAAATAINDNPRKRPAVIEDLQDPERGDLFDDTDWRDDDIA